MKKKFLIGLGPLLVTAAFMVMPAVSQANHHPVCGTPPNCPHLYKNGVIGTAGKKVRQIAWGTLELKNKFLGSLICHNVFAGYGENPVGGGAAVGQVQAFYPYECEDLVCTTTLGGKAIHVNPLPNSFPWKAEVFETANGKKEFRQATGLKGPTKNKKPTTPGFIDFEVNCEGVTTPEFFGEQDPLLQNNGTAIGSGPGTELLQPEKVNPESHDLESEIEIVGTGETEGPIKVEGYGEEELLEVKNP